MPLELNAPSAACGMRYVACSLWHCDCVSCVCTLHILTLRSAQTPFPLRATQIGTKYTCDPFFARPSVFRLVRLKESTNGRTDELTQAGTEEVAREFQETDDGTRIGTRI